MGHSQGAWAPFSTTFDFLCAVFCTKQFTVISVNALAAVTCKQICIAYCDGVHAQLPEACAIEGDGDGKLHLQLTAQEVCWDVGVAACRVLGSLI